MYKKSFKKLGALACLATAAIWSPGHQANAASYQTFLPFAYTNPATMDLVQTFSMTVGAGNKFVDTKFKGTHLGVRGSSKSNEYYFFPNGQIMMRVHPKIVVGMDVSDPLNVLIDYKGGNANNYITKIKMKNYGPKVSVQALDWLSLGAGLDVQQAYKGGIAFFIPVNNQLAYLNSVGDNQVKLGWNLGALFKIKPATFIGLSYHSLIKNNNPSVNNLTIPGLGTFQANGKAYTPSPDVASLNVTQFFSEKFLVSLTARWVHWKVLKNLRITNVPLIGPNQTPGLLQFPLNYKNAWVGQAVARYQFAEKWAGLLAFEYDSNPVPTAFRTVGLPSYEVWIGGIGAQYLPTKNIVAQLVYGVGFSNPKLRDVTTRGKVNIVGHVLDASLTYKF